MARRKKRTIRKKKRPNRQERLLKREQVNPKLQPPQLGDSVSWARPGHVTREIKDTDKIGPSTTDAKYALLSEKTKAVSLIGLLKDHFKIRESGGLNEIGRLPEPDSLAKLSSEIMNMWPRDFVQASVDGDGLATLFWGNRTPNSISNCITRASLYADRILVVNPFVDLMLYHPNHSPAIAPEKWVRHYSHAALFFVMLEPWIQSDIVQVVCNPACLNASLLQQLAKDAKEALTNELESYEEFENLFAVEAMSDLLFQMTEHERHQRNHDWVLPVDL